MAKAGKDKRRWRIWLWVAGGVLVLALGAYLARGWFWSEPSGQLPPDQQAHQELVAEVILSTDREELIGDAPTRGAADADLILLEFSDFQCPFCAIAAGNMKPFMDQHEDRMLFVYKFFPLTRIHPEAMPAAKAAWAAQQQGQFWLYHDALFVHQDRLGEELYTELAQLLELDMDKFNQDRQSAAAEAAVTRDLQLAQRLQLNGTPTFILNDLLLPPGPPTEILEEILTKVKPQ